LRCFLIYSIYSIVPRLYFFGIYNYYSVACSDLLRNQMNPSEMSARKIVSFILLFALVSVFFICGPLYRSLFYYTSCGVRNTYRISSPALEEYIDSLSALNPPESTHDVIALANTITSEQLSFQTSHSEVNPNLLFPGGRSHCVGYSAFFTTVCNGLLEKYNFDQQWSCASHRGNIYLLGFNLHDCFRSSFFADHDFNCMSHHSSGEIICTDPTLFDYIGIATISFHSS
jgi:hypothetical protein